MSNQSGGGHLYRRLHLLIQLTLYKLGLQHRIMRLTELANMVSHKNCELKFYSTWILT
jgi:hypothetical protein